MRTVVGVMIAKRDSKRLPGKNRKLFDDRPLFWWNLEKLIHIAPVVYFDSDDHDMLEQAERLGAVVMERPQALREHEIPSVALFQSMMERAGIAPGAIVNVQANSPNTSMSTIREAIDIMKHTTCSELMTVYPGTRVNNGSVWGISYLRLMSYGDFRKPCPDVLLCDEAIDIHTQDDFDRALATHQAYMSSEAPSAH